MRYLVRLLAVSAIILGLGAVPAAGEAGGSAKYRVAQASIAAGRSHVCVLLVTGDVRCWGLGHYGALGHGNAESIGDDEAAGSAGNVPLGGKAIAITAGYNHTCALLRSGKVRCWGQGDSGRLGYGNTENIGDDEAPASAGKVRLGGKAIAIQAGGVHTCAILVGGRVRCWGEGNYAALGYGNLRTIGDNETPASVGRVRIGGRAQALTAGYAHTCALLRRGDVRCWGESQWGQLGHGNTEMIGDDEFPASAGDVPLGGKSIAIAAGAEHTCALLRRGDVRCWGNSQWGQLGHGNTDTIGDDEFPASAGDVPLGDGAVSVAAGSTHTCVVLNSRQARCWGRGESGALGYGNTDIVGDDETPASAGNVPVGRTTIAMDGIGNATCALGPHGGLTCWGAGPDGQLGYGNTEVIGDDEAPATVGRVQVGGTIRTRADTRLTLRRNPRRDRAAPYVYRVRGAVRGTFVANPTTCGGSVRLAVKRGPRTVLRRTSIVGDTCAYSKRLVVRRARLPVTRRTRLRIVASFTGTTNLRPARRSRVAFAH